jgi:hypothetical protein
MIVKGFVPGTGSVAYPGTMTLPGLRQLAHKARKYQWSLPCCPPEGRWPPGYRLGYPGGHRPPLPARALTAISQEYGPEPGTGPRFFVIMRGTTVTFTGHPRATGLAGLDLGAEPPSRAGGAPRRRRAPRYVLEADGQGTRPGPEADHHGHLHHVRRGSRCHDAPDPGALLGGDGAAEQADLSPDPFGRPGRELPGRAETGQDLNQHLTELPRPRRRQARLSRPARLSRRGAHGERGFPVRRDIRSRRVFRGWHSRLARA